jgi:hypothetical protein
MSQFLSTEWGLLQAFLLLIKWMNEMEPVTVSPEHKKTEGKQIIHIKIREVTDRQRICIYMRDNKWAPRAVRTVQTSFLAFMRYSSYNPNNYIMH